MENTKSFYLEKVLDGSTFVGWIDLDFDIRIRRKVRLVNIRCHDVKVPMGFEAKLFVERLLYQKRLEVKVIRDRFEKFSTILVVLYMKMETRLINVNDLLVQQHFEHFTKDAHNAPTPDDASAQ